MSEPKDKIGEFITTEVPHLTEHLFRQEAGKLVSVLTGIFGIDRLQLAEDVVQDALVRAMQTWPYYGIPDNPPAWLLQTAKNLALDVIRREKSFRDKEPQIITSVEQRLSEPASDDLAQFDDEIADARLRLIFTCCHPVLPQEAQIALALKTLCGFSPAEIAKAFLSTEAAIAKRLTRARQRIRDEGVPFEIPSGPELAGRLTGVLQVLYLLFNEGYNASVGDDIVREELCMEAIRLTILITEHPAGNQPISHALLALMFLNGARLPTRVDAAGNILLLAEQDRSLWDRRMIQRGIWHMGQAAVGTEISEYHIQAAISACHCTAPAYASTDWQRILALYDHLMTLNDSPVIALNRAVAVAQIHGPAKGIETVRNLLNRHQLNSYHLLHAVLGEFEAQLKHFPAAADHLRQALRFTSVSSERALLMKKLKEWERGDKEPSKSLMIHQRFNHK